MDKVLVHVDVQWAEIPPPIYTGKIRWPGVQIRFLLEDQHFIFGRW